MIMFSKCYIASLLTSIFSILANIRSQIRLIAFHEINYA